jgi:hypothetical protein
MPRSHLIFHRATSRVQNFPNHSFLAVLSIAGRLLPDIAQLIRRCPMRNLYPRFMFHPPTPITAPSFSPLPILPPRTMAMPHHRCHQADEEATSPRSSAAGCCVLLTRSHHTASGATAGSTLPRPRGCSVRNPRWRRR